MTYLPRGVLDRPQIVETQQVSTIADLKALDPLTGIDRQFIVYVLGQSLNTDDGGGIYFWNPTSDEADDGEYIIRPNNSLGSGRWVQFITETGAFKDSVSPDDFGAVGDGTTNDYPAFLAAVSTGKAITLTEGKSYRLNTGISTLNRDVFINGNGATIVMGADILPLTIAQSFTNIQSISSISNGVAYTFPDGDGTTVVTTLTVSNGSAYSVNDFVKVVSDDLNSGPNTAFLERRGEFAQIGAISGNILYLYGQLRDTYTTTPRVAKMASQYRVYIKDINFDYHSSAAASWNEPYLDLNGCYKYVLMNCHAVKGMAAFVETDGCLQGRTLNVTAANLRTSSSNSAYGYTLVEYASESGVHVGLGGDNVRHVYTTGTRSTTISDARIERYGRTAYSVISDGQGTSCSAAPWDTHADAFMVKFNNCVARAGWRGDDASQGGFNLRGLKCELNNCSAYGGQGLSTNPDFASPDNSRGHVINNFLHETYSVGSSGTALNISGISGGDVSDITINNMRVRQMIAANGAYLNFDYAKNIRINGLSIESRQSGTSTRTVDLNNGSTVTINNMFVDYTNATGTTFRTFQLNDAASVLNVNGLEVVRASASWQALVNFSSLNGTARITNLTYDSQFSDADGAVNIGSSATYFKRLRYGNRFIRTVTIAGSVSTTGGDDVVLLNKTVGAATTVNLMSSPPTGIVQTIKDGKGDAAANNITIVPAAGTINGAANLVIATNYGSANIMYTGTEWVTI
jgi:hypothetical protein